MEAVDAQVPQRKDGPHKQRYCRRSDMFAVVFISECQSMFEALSHIDDRCLYYSSW